MMDQSRMATPPAPQPPYLRRLRVVSAVFCLLSALGVIAIEPIRQMSIYAVSLVVFAMLGAVVTVPLYWFFRRRVEAAYWTPAREVAHIDGVVRAFDERRGKGMGVAQARVILDHRRDAPLGVFTRIWNATATLRGYRPGKWWTPR